MLLAFQDYGHINEERTIMISVNGHDGNFAASHSHRKPAHLRGEVRTIFGVFQDEAWRVLRRWGARVSAAQVVR